MVTTDIGYASTRDMDYAGRRRFRQWHINPNWKLIAEMPFGTSTQEPGEKQFAPLEERILVFK